MDKILQNSPEELGKSKMKINEIITEAGIARNIAGAAAGLTKMFNPDLGKTMQSALSQSDYQQSLRQPTTEPPAARQPQDIQPPVVRVIQTVITPTGQTVFKKSDNKWYRENGNVVTEPSDIKQLNQMIINAKEIAKSKGTTVPKVIKAQSTAAPEPDMPDVFTSNRTPAVFTSNRR